MSSFESKAYVVCSEFNLEILGFDGGYVFCRDKHKRVFPVGEDIVASWIEDFENIREFDANVKKKLMIHLDMMGYIVSEDDNVITIVLEKKDGTKYALPLLYDDLISREYSIESIVRRINELIQNDI